MRYAAPGPPTPSTTVPRQPITAPGRPAETHPPSKHSHTHSHSHSHDNGATRTEPAAAGTVGHAAIWSHKECRRSLQQITGNEPRRRRRRQGETTRQPIEAAPLQPLQVGPSLSTLPGQSAAPAAGRRHHWRPRRAAVRSARPVHVSRAAGVGGARVVGARAGELAAGGRAERHPLVVEIGVLQRLNGRDALTGRKRQHPLRGDGGGGSSNWDNRYRYSREETGAD